MPQIVAPASTKDVLEGPGHGKRIFNTTVFQPVMPIQLTEEWKLINRPVITVNTFEVPGVFNFRPNFSFDNPGPPSINDPFSTEFGLGDTMLIQWLSNTPADSKMTFGFGWNWMFPTATDGALGTGKTSVGPSVVAICGRKQPIAKANSTMRSAMPVPVPFTKMKVAWKAEVRAAEVWETSPHNRRIPLEGCGCCGSRMT